MNVKIVSAMVVGLVVMGACGQAWGAAQNKPNLLRRGSFSGGLSNPQGQQGQPAAAAAARLQRQPIQPQVQPAAARPDADIAEIAKVASMARAKEQAKIDVQKRNKQQEEGETEREKKAKQFEEKKKFALGSTYQQSIWRDISPFHANTKAVTNLEAAEFENPQEISSWEKLKLNAGSSDVELRRRAVIADVQKKFKEKEEAAAAGEEGKSKTSWYAKGAAGVLVLGEMAQSAAMIGEAVAPKGGGGGEGGGRNVDIDITYPSTSPWGPGTIVPPGEDKPAEFTFVDLDKMFKEICGDQVQNDQAQAGPTQPEGEAIDAGGKKA